MSYSGVRVFNHRTLNYGVHTSFSPYVFTRVYQSLLLTIFYSYFTTYYSIVSHFFKTRARVSNYNCFLLWGLYLPPLLLRSLVSIVYFLTLTFYSDLISILFCILLLLKRHYLSLFFLCFSS